VKLRAPAAGEARDSRRLRSGVKDRLNGPGLERPRGGLGSRTGALDQAAAAANDALVRRLGVDRAIAGRRRRKGKRGLGRVLFLRRALCQGRHELRRILRLGPEFRT
jgi:hypothetical protein